MLDPASFEYVAAPQSPLLAKADQKEDRAEHGCPANAGPVGLARYTTLRAWLSQWSYDQSRARTGANAPHISVPALVIENGADDATPAAHPRKIFELLGSADKQFACIEGATHYYQQQPDRQKQAVDLCRDWLNARGMAMT
ncbi:hypothetical protein [Novosphingobium sp.]|uniref:hypothetical protein n=1 Tax=Novosphingobium sp. TaxID=1874826 RepID=UPI0027359F8B|nr:hypothetical protein [Novosphingobium sp.]MDP3908237.1 hypothetical protein [Novosphingobium sp.]